LQQVALENNNDNNNKKNLFNAHLALEQVALDRHGALIHP
jgi:hypothetical protein